VTREIICQLEVCAVKFHKVNLGLHHIHLLRVTYPVTTREDSLQALDHLIMSEPFVGVEQYQVGGAKHLLIGTVDFDDFDEDIINVQVQLHDNDELGLGSVPAPGRPGDLIGIMSRVSLTTPAQCYAEMSFEEAEGEGEEHPATVFPLPYSLAHIEDTPIDLITGIRGIKHRAGNTKREYTFILDRTEETSTSLSLEFEWEGALAADTLAHVAERASAIATRLGMPEPATTATNTLMRPRPKRHRH
jgi:hypothetical protein